MGEPIRFELNGRPVEVVDASPSTTLLQYLRERAGLVGTKEGCAEGDCGACNVAVILRDFDGKPRWCAVNSCLVLLPSLHGRSVCTVEHLAEGDRLHPVQRALVVRNGSQCGYCTPGFVMSLFEAHYRDDLDGPEQLDDQLAGNLCRCTGYRSIRLAAQDVAGACPRDRFSARLEHESALDPIDYTKGDERYVRPRGLDEVWPLLAERPTARIVAGSTDLGLEVTKQHRRFECLVDVTGIDALRRIDIDDTHLRIGAAVRLTELERACADALPAVTRMLRFFAARPIKHRATVGGNLCNASPIGDLAPILAALDAEVVVGSRDGERRLPLEAFFVGYRQTALQPGEILVRIDVPRPSATTWVGAYKVCKRRELDISAVCAGMAVRLGSDRSTVESLRLVFGGMAATTRRAVHTERALQGRPWTLDSIHAALDELDRDFAPLDDHRGSAHYRRTVARNLLVGFFVETGEGTLDRLPPRPTAAVANDTAIGGPA